MQVTETLSDGLRRQYRVVLPSVRIDGHVDKRLTELGKTLRLPGFRPGKIPMGLLKKRYGQNVMGEVLQEAIDQSTDEVLKDRGLRPAMRPKVEIVNFAPGIDLEFSLDFETLPDVPEPDLGAISIERPTAEVTDEAITNALERLAKSRATYAPVEPARPAESGDQVTIDFAGSIDGVPFEGGKAEGFDLVLGSNRFIPGFEDQLIGKSAGDSLDVHVTFPEGYGTAELSGKPAVFAVTVHTVSAPVVPAIDEEFATGVGVQSLTELRQNVRDRMERDYKQASRQRAKRALLDQFAASNLFTVPSGMVDAEFEQIWKEVTEAKARGVTDPESEGKTDEQLKEEYRAIADRRVRLGLLLSDVGRRNNIQVSEDEVRRAVIEQARQYPGKEREVVEFYRNNAGALDGLRAPIYEEKVVDFVLEMATVTDKPVTPEELFAEVD